MPKVMLVDDEDSMREMLTNLLRRRNYDAFGCGDGKTAVEKFKTEKPDIILLDVHLPEMDGEKVFDEIRKQDKKVKIYFATGSTAESERLKAVKPDANGFILKPFSINEILRLLSENKTE